MDRFLNDNIKIETASIIVGTGEHIDVRYMISYMSIQESIFHQCMSGSVSLADGVGLIDKLPIVGEEFFSLIFRSGESGDTFIHKVFSIYNVSNRKKMDNTLEHYTLNFSSIEGMVNIMSTVNRNYIGKTYTDIAKNVFNDYIINSPLKGGPEGTPYMSVGSNLIKKTTLEGGVGDGGATSGLQSLTTVGDTPFKVIQKCANLAQSTDYPDSDFVFYEDKYQFNFCSISSLLEQEPVQFAQYIMGDHGREEKGKNNRFRWEIVNQMEYNEGPNALRSSSTGMYGNQIHAFDPILKKRSTITNNYLKIQNDTKIKSFSTLDKNNLMTNKSLYAEDSGTSHSQYYINNIFDNNYEDVEYMKGRISEKSDRNIFHHDNSYKSRGRTTMKLSLLNNYILTIAVGGNTNFVAGNVVNVEIPISSNLEEDKLKPYTHLFGNKTKNKFLITAVTHNFIGTAGRFFTHLTLAKDSYSSDINTSYDGRME